MSSPADLVLGRLSEVLDCDAYRVPWDHKPRVEYDKIEEAIRKKVEPLDGLPDNDCGHDELIQEGRWVYCDDCPATWRAFWKN